MKIGGLLKKSVASYFHVQDTINDLQRRRSQQNKYKQCVARKWELKKHANSSIYASECNKGRCFASTLTDTHSHTHTEPYSNRAYTQLRISQPINKSRMVITTKWFLSAQENGNWSYSSGNGGSSSSSDSVGGIDQSKCWPMHVPYVLRSIVCHCIGIAFQMILCALFTVCGIQILPKLYFCRNSISLT